MQWFRTITRFVRVLVVLFLVAQFAGVVSSPLASAQAVPNAVASHAHHQHAHDQGREDRADHCCALHAFFVGVLLPVIAVDTVGVVGQRLAADLADIGFGVASGRLDRPPRPLL